MKSGAPAGEAVSIDNCDREPIHVPGAIQPHGALLAVDADLRVCQASENVAQHLSAEPAALFGRPLDELLDAASATLIRDNLKARSFKQFNPIRAVVAGREFDAIVHRSRDLLVVELEPAGTSPHATYRDYGANTHQAMVRLQSAESLSELLQTAAEVVRWVTGYDRVMIYRFSEEGHGQVVAEDRIPEVEPFLGLHYPASDIPAQARRLYALNWLRLIPDIEYQRSPVIAAEPRPGESLDMTHAVLRSVSPIHVEYLRNMGVRGSMSVSLVHDGKLWGLVACHHYAPRYVPYAARLTCELLGQMLSTLILSWERKEDAEMQTRIAERSVRLLERLTRADYIAAGLAEHPEDLLGMIRATGAAILEDSRYTAVGHCPPEAAVRAFAAWMADQQQEIACSANLAVDFPGAPAIAPEAAGVLAMGLPDTKSNAVLWFRPVLTRTVSWAGNPEKTYSEGPNGPRLTPRGSFALWQQTVKDQSERWSRQEIEGARQLRAGLVDVMVRKGREMEQARDMLLGMVSHDLRAPLGTISLGAQVLQSGIPDPSDVTRVSARIASSSDRMRRMIEHLLEYTRSRSGSQELNLQHIDLVTLFQQLVEETQVAHPGARVELIAPPTCPFDCDPDRMARIISNLLGNARHHGDPSRPIRLILRCSDADVEVEVRNHGKPIPEDKLSTIFEPFRRAADKSRPERNAGLGLGLYIVKNFVELHEGMIRISSSEEEGTVCTLRFPRLDKSKSGAEDQP